jgi:hypothetical protein
MLSLSSDNRSNFECGSFESNFFNDSSGFLLRDVSNAGCALLLFILTSPKGRVVWLVFEISATVNGQRSWCNTRDPLRNKFHTTLKSHDFHL